MAVSYGNNGIIIGGNGQIQDIGSFTESDLASGTFTVPVGNSSALLTLTTVNALTVKANPGLPNFAIDIDNTGNSSDVEVTVVKSDGTTVLRHSVAGETTVGKNTYTQLTCERNCWTLAEFELPSTP